jgi:hypothetical protein
MAKDICLSRSGQLIDNAIHVGMKLWIRRRYLEVNGETKEFV